MQELPSKIISSEDTGQEKKLPESEVSQGTKLNENATILLVSPESLIEGFSANGLVRQEGDGEGIRVWYRAEVNHDSPGQAADTAFSNFIYAPDNKQFKEAFSNLKDQVVVDLGAGSNPRGYYIANSAKAKGYIGVEPNFYRELAGSLVKNIDPKKNKHIGWEGGMEVKPQYHLNKIPAVVVREDMLSFLKRLPDNSVSILCSGVDGFVLSNERNYRGEVAKEIVRVLSPNGVYIGERYGGHISLNQERGIDEVVVQGEEKHQSLSLYRKADSS
ncbi:MAG: hypothetical protein HY006_02450 [Candidatus Sungbacteria bacterium]|nr:hypothetical protein [Candidatus Sungbacteria bacterium]